MFVIIAGAGEVGRQAAEALSTRGDNVTVIDLDARQITRLSDSLDVRTLVGHCAHFDVLEEAGVDKCDLMIAATDVDEINMLAASMAKAAGAKKTIVRAHRTANVQLRGTDFLERLGIDEFICPEHLASLEIVRTLRNPGSIALEEFASGKLLMLRLVVQGSASAVGHRLMDIRLPAQTRLITVEHEGVVQVANANTPIEAGDAVTLVGKTEAFDSARKLFQKGKEKRKAVTVMGETTTATWLCRALRSRVFSVRLFVQSDQRAEELAEKLPHVTVLRGDPTESATFADEHLEQSDAFIAVTDDDEDNILAAAHAKAMGVKTAIVLVQRARYMHLLPLVGIDHAFSPQAVAVRAIVGMLESGPLRSLAAFSDDLIEVYQIRPSAKAKVLGHDLRNIKLPDRTMIAAIRRGEEVHVPGAEDHVEVDDHVLIVGPRGIDDDLVKLFTKK